MDKLSEEIEESQVGVVLPVSVTLGFSQPILLRPTKYKDTKVMFVSSLSAMIKGVNGQLPHYIEDLKLREIINNI